MYFWDSWQAVQEADGGGAVEKTYVYGESIDEVVKAVLPDAADLDDDMDTSEEVELFYHHNSLGSVVALTDDAGNVVESYTYAPYGAATVRDDVGAVVSGTQVEQPFMFTGRRLDFEESSGLYYYRLRFYDPVAGRFVSRDPIGMWGDPGQRGNAQNYCGNNPVNFIDPMGLDGYGTWPGMKPREGGTNFGGGWGGGGYHGRPSNEPSGPRSGHGWSEEDGKRHADEEAKKEPPKPLTTYDGPEDPLIDLGTTIIGGPVIGKVGKALGKAIGKALGKVGEKFRRIFGRRAKPPETRRPPEPSRPPVDEPIDSGRPITGERPPAPAGSTSEKIPLPEVGGKQARYFYRGEGLYFQYFHHMCEGTLFIRVGLVKGQHALAALMLHLRRLARRTGAKRVRLDPGQFNDPAARTGLKRAMDRFGGKACGAKNSRGEPIIDFPVN